MGLWGDAGAVLERRINAWVYRGFGAYALRARAVHNAYVQVVRFWRVKAACGECVNGVLRLWGDKGD